MNSNNHKIIKTVLQNGSRSIILHVYMESDGVGKELENYVLIDPETFYTEIGSEFSKKLVRPTLTQAWYSFSWFDTLVSFDDLVPTPSWMLARDGANHVDFRCFGGIKDRYAFPKDASSSDRTGRILLSTTNFAPYGSKGTLILELRKSAD